MEDGLLIEQVAGFPALYNKNDSRFKNKTAKEQAWRKIAEIMGCSVEACIGRWTVLRAKYTNLKRQIRETPSGSAGFSINWPHYEAMGFLDPFLATRKTISNIKVASTLETDQGLSPAWDTMSQSINLADEEDNLSEAFSPPSTPNIPTAPSVSAAFKAKMATLRRDSVVTGNKRNAQEAMCQSITNAIDSFEKRHRSSEVNEGLLSWAKSLVYDMDKLLTPSEQTVYKRKCYKESSRISIGYLPPIESPINKCIIF